MHEITKKIAEMNSHGAKLYIALSIGSEEVQFVICIKLHDKIIVFHQNEI